MLMLAFLFVLILTSLLLLASLLLLVSLLFQASLLFLVSLLFACIPAFTVTVASLSLCCCVTDVDGVYFVVSSHAWEKTLSNVIFTYFVITFKIHN
jgi:hypothetical protein